MKRSFLLAGSSIIFAFIAGAGYFSAYSYLDSKSIEVIAKEGGANEQKLQDSRAGSMRQLFASTVSEREILGKYFVRQEGVAGVVGRLERLGAESGVSVEVSGIGIEDGALSGAKDSMVRSVDITIQATGSRNAVENFLSRVELFPYVLSIKEASLEKLIYTEGRGESWRIAASLRIGVIR